MAFNYSPKVVTDGLVLYLDAANPNSYVSGSTTWRDISRSGINGTLINGPTYSSANGGSIIFDGSNDYVSLGNNLDQNGPLTIMSWIYTTTVNSGARSIISNCNAGGNQQDYVLEINRTAGKVGAFWGDVLLLVSNQLLVINQWYYVGFVRSGSTSNWTLNLYINGTNDSNTTTTVNPNATNAGTSIGRAGDAPFQYFSGRISNTQIYNRALSATEVRQNYNATKTRFGLT
jgi:hypothetical protein